MYEKPSSTKVGNRLDDAMARLDSRSRHVMELWLEGESQSEIAEALDMPERAVAVLRVSSLWRLRDLIAQQPSPEAHDDPNLLEIRLK
jgi:DNA-directed RNA polymerase specialized sigma24 family protein